MSNFWESDKKAKDFILKEKNLKNHLKEISLLQVGNKINSALNINRVKGVDVDFRDRRGVKGYILTFPSNEKHKIDIVKDDLKLMLGQDFGINDFGNTIVINIPNNIEESNKSILKEKHIKPYVLDSIISEVKEMTHWNEHGGAYQFIASSLGYRDYEKKFHDINKQHERFGSLPPDLSELRYHYYKEMFKQIKKDYGQDVYKKIYSVT